MHFADIPRHISLKMNEGSLTRTARKRRRNGGKGRYVHLADNGWNRGLLSSQARASDGGLWRSWLLMFDRAAGLEVDG